MKEMKDSGIDWIEQIPKHWEVKRLKDLAEFGSGTTPKSSNEKYYEDGDIPWLITGDVQNKLVTENKVNITELALKENPNLKQYPINTVLLAMYGGGTIGNVGVMTYPAYINQACCAMIPNKNTFAKFLFYYLLTKQGRIISTGVGGTQINLSQNKISAYPIAIPPLSEQQQIADYLDKKTGEIDTQISLLKQQKDTYARLKRSLINEVITRGLNPNAEFKDSGVEWIGEIPKHWEVNRLKDLAYLYPGLTGKAGDDFFPEQENGTKPYIPFTNVFNNFEINPKALMYVRMSDDECQNKVKKNDLIFLMSSEDYDAIAKSSLVSKDLGEVYLNSFCRGLRFTSKSIYPKFINYQLLAETCRDALRFEARGFTRINIKIDKITSHIVFLPPLSEQQQIADYLDEKTAEIDKNISLIEKKIETYKRFKQSLIDEMVTGKRSIN